MAWQSCGGLRVKNPITANWLCRKNKSATPPAIVEVYFVLLQWDTWPFTSVRFQPTTMTASKQSTLANFLVDEGLPESYRRDAHNWFLPLIDQLQYQLADADDGTPAATMVLGINGAQGTGKSTLARLIEVVLESRGKRVANLSMDDFYLSQTQRQRLAADIHPLLATRGVPGTHDTALAIQTIAALQAATVSSVVHLPRFDKAIDDLLTVEEWPGFEGRADLIIVEGWFLGAEPQLDSELETAVNTLEENEDAEGLWRRYANAQLAGSYQQWFACIDHLIMLKAPAFEQVKVWRSLQEVKLAARSKRSGASKGIMNGEQLERFIAHFERLTRHCLRSLPAKANQVFFLDADHQVVNHHVVNKTPA